MGIIIILTENSNTSKNIVMIWPMTPLTVYSCWMQVIFLALSKPWQWHSESPALQSEMISKWYLKFTWTFILYRMSWSTYYLPDKYPVEFDPPCPLVRDPANPGHNVADTLTYWGQFRSELKFWFKSLGVQVGQLESWLSAWDNWAMSCKNRP